MAETYNPTPVRNTAYTAVEDGDDLDAASVRPMLEGLADHGEWAGDEIDGHETRLDAHDAHLTAVDAALLTKGGLAATNAWTGVNGFQNSVFITGPVVSIATGTMLRMPPIVDIPDLATQVIGPEQGSYFRIDSTFGGGHIIRLRDTGAPALTGGEILEIFFDAVGSEGSASWVVRRQTNGGGSNNILAFNNAPYSPDAGATWARFQFRSGVGWVCAGASGAIAPGFHYKS